MNIMPFRLKHFSFSAVIFSAVILLIAYSACRKDDNASADPLPHAALMQVPPGFPAPYLSPENPLTNEGILLGRRLYYDSMLSAGGPLQGMACASCHFQEKGFIKPGIPVLAHVNLAWNRNFLWRGEVSGSLEDIMRFEVNGFFKTDLSGIKDNENYKVLYKAAFGDAEINTERTAFALAQFARTLVSGNALFDRYLQKKATLPPAAERGYQLFYSEKGDCFHCHGNALFTDNGFHNIGLVSKSAADMGRYHISGAASDIGKFKTPSLRNVALRDVFMHDGRFKTLEEVLNHYANGVQYTAFLDPVLDKKNISLSPSDVSDIVAFLHTLTDSSFLLESKFSKP